MSRPLFDLILFHRVPTRPLGTSPHSFVVRGQEKQRARTKVTLQPTTPLGRHNQYFLHVIPKRKGVCRSIYRYL